MSNILRCAGRIRSGGVRCDVGGIRIGYLVTRRGHGDCSTTKGELGKGREGGGGVYKDLDMVTKSPAAVPKGLDAR